MKPNVEALAYPLPEDVEKLKWFGDLNGALTLIEHKLKENIPEVLRQRLEWEKVQLPRMYGRYMVTPEQAEKELRERIRDFGDGELERLRLENVVDWMFINGEVRYLDNYYENLLKIRADIAARQLKPAKPAPGTKTNFELLDEIIAKMKKDGGATCHLKLRATGRLNVPAEEKGKKAAVHLPLPVEYAQVQDLSLTAVSADRYTVAPKDAAQRTVCFTGTAESLSDTGIEYEFNNVSVYTDPKPEEARADHPNTSLSEQAPHIVFTPYLRALAKEILGDETNPLKKARLIYDFITTHVNYSYMRVYSTLPVIPEYCASRLRGDCGVQALTFITLCRIAGIPAEWQSGLYANCVGEAGSHDWARFYVAPYGWLFADCSFGGAAWRAGATERWNFYFGNLDPYRVPLARDFQQPFMPPMTQLRRDPYDNQKGEAELEDRFVTAEEFDGEAYTLVCDIL